MKSIAFVVLAGIFFFLNFSCQAPGSKAETALNGSAELIVEPGEHWFGKMKVAFFSVKKTPQMAAWIEDADGRYVETITVTNRSAQKKWRGNPKDGRPEALPAWNHRQQNKSAVNEIDRVSTATPKGSVEAQIDESSLIRGNTYKVYLEINHSYDYNDRWTEGNSGVNGQPSLLYHAQFAAGQPGRIALTPLGYGSVDGSNGNVSGGLEQFTSALGIIKEAYIKW